MLCSKCYEIILQGKEIQIEGSIICKECALNSLTREEVVGKCHECLKPIHKNEITHEVYENGGAESSEKLMKCQLCYERGLKIAKLKREIGDSKRGFENFLPLGTGLVLFMITVDKEKVGGAPILLVLVLFICLTSLSPLSFVLIKKIIRRKYRNKTKKSKIIIK